MFLGKLVHEFPCFQVRQFRGGSIVFVSSAMPHPQDKDATCYGTANFLFSPHACAQATRDLQGHFLWQVAFFPESVKYRLSSVVST